MSVELLNQYTKTIKRYEKNIKHNYIQIAFNLYEIQEFELLKDSEYKNIYDYALNEFGFEKSKTNELINIYKKFFFEEIKSKIGVLTYGDYSITQLKYMLNISDEQMKKCNPNLSVRAIKEIRVKSSTRVNNEDIENTNILKNETVITGVFLDKNQEEKEEEKQKTIIVSELPKTSPQIQEEKTVTTITETITSQNKDFVPNPYETYKDKYDEAVKKVLSLNIEIQELKNVIKKQDERFENYECMFNFYYDELYNINNPIQNDKIDKLCCELYDFIKNHKIPKKIQFMQNVI